MLHYKSVSSELLELLEFIMNQREFNEFNLVGGTSLALQMGHRISIDIDLFGASEIDEDLFLEVLKKFGTVQIIKKSKNILICSVNGIKVDFVNYQYRLLESPRIEENIRLVKKKDIAAMKVNAVAGRGSIKDFIDVYFLLNEFSINEMIGFYLQKYPDGSEFMVRKSLTYFDDADNEVAPILFHDISWSEIKKTILLSIDKE
ncbi:MAG: hypothetical protein EBS86_16495 [Crocinitomicaceae bacterium]|nr:hypothetical protein [Crocinitomicaceae bacterium]